MRIRRSFIAIAAGAILATAGVGFSAPIHSTGNSNRQGYSTTSGRQSSSFNNGYQVQAGQGRSAYVQQSVRIGENGYRPRGEAMEWRGHQLWRAAESHERVERRELRERYGR